MTVLVTRTDCTADDLRRHAAGANDAAIARRLVALALVLDGRKRADAARLAGMDWQTLRDWVHRYNADGIAELKDRHGGTRVGQQGTLTYVWAEKGSRPAALKDLRYEWAYLFGAVCADRGVGAALVMPHCNTDAMNLHLAEISQAVAKDAHAAVVLDGAGWHQIGGRLLVPPNISLVHLPSYSPELNPVENIWDYLRDNKLSNSVFEGYDAIVDQCCIAWNWLINTPERIRSIATRSWAKTVTA